MTSFEDSLTVADLQYYRYMCSNWHWVCSTTNYDATEDDYPVEPCTAPGCGGTYGTSYVFGNEFEALRERAAYRIEYLEGIAREGHGFVFEDYFPDHAARAFCAGTECDWGVEVALCTDGTRLSLDDAIQAHNTHVEELLVPYKKPTMSSNLPAAVRGTVEVWPDTEDSNEN